MGGINGGDGLNFGVEQAAHDLAEAIAAVAHWEQNETVLGTRLSPTPRDGLRRRARAERAFEFIGDDEDQISRHSTPVPRSRLLGIIRAAVASVHGPVPLSSLKGYPQT